jgi:hypothetical protein
VGLAHMTAPAPAGPAPELTPYLRDARDRYLARRAAWRAAGGDPRLYRAHITAWLNARRQPAP